MSDSKAVRAAEYLKQYCGERGCDPEFCAFCEKKSKICILQSSRLPENYNLESIQLERLNE